MPTPRPPARPRGPLCEVDDCTTTAKMLIKATDRIVQLCINHARETQEMFPGAPMLFPNRSRVDWHDSAFHADIPEVLHGANPTPFYRPFVESEWEND